jgi:hypothetical protein
MLERFRGTATRPRGEHGAVAAREREERLVRDDDDDDRGRDGAALGVEAGRTVRARQRAEFGGLNWGAAVFGWLVAVGLAALLTALLGAASVATGLTKTSKDKAASNAETIGIGGGILLLLVLLIAYYAGGYVAGRMSRFDGARQGFGVWMLGLLVTIALAVAGVVLGSEYNILEQLNLPRIPVDEGDLTTGGIIALVAIVLGTLLAAVLGGKAGERYHKRIDRVGFAD